MIFLQLLAGIGLIPLTVLLMLMFNVYLFNWAYLSFVVVSFLIYAILWGFAFVGFGMAIILFLALLIFYSFRMRRLSRIRCAFMALRGSIKSKYLRHRTTFIIPLSILNILKWLPKSASQELSRKTGLDYDIPHLVDRIVISSIGTYVEIIDKDVTIFFEIK